MIPQASITEWARLVPWPTVEQVEQDLLLSRLLIEIASDDYLGSELVFRGGTCLHKLHAPTPLRYSEDLDYVRRTAGPITQVVDAVRVIGEALGMRVNTSITRHPKIILRAPFETGRGSMRLKVEVNTFERSSSSEPTRIPYRIDSSWFSGSSDVLTFTIDELVATKIRALYERSKGRDLFDLWLAVTRLGVPPSSIVRAFASYRPEGYTRSRAVLNLREKVGRPAFRDDLRPLVTVWPEDYEIDDAAERVIAEVLALIE